MTAQLSLLDAKPVIIPRDTHVEKVERPRLAGQCLKIYERLLQGPATARQLSIYSLKYTSRVSDLRAAGIDVRVVKRDQKTGETVYALRGSAAAPCSAAQGTVTA